MKRRIFCVLLALCVAFGALPFAVFATESGENPAAIRLGIGGIDGYDSAAGYDYLYYGIWKDAPVKWRVLDSKTNTGAEGLFLLSEVLFGRTEVGGIFFNGNEGATNAWQTSSARYWCVNEFTAFTDAEYSAILATYKSDAKSGTTFPAVANILNGDKVFFLSGAEASNSSFGFPDNPSRVAYYNGKVRPWFLRSPPYNGSSYASVASNDGSFRSCSIGTYNATARPAFNLSAEAVLFSSPAVGGKNANGLTAVADYSGNERKLTVADNARGGFTVMPSQRSGNKILFTYDGAATGSNEYLSAMVVNGGKVSYYGRLKNLKDAAQFGGNAIVALPEGFDTAKGDRLYIFNEQCNGDYKTDYASPLCELSLEETKPNVPRFKIGEDNGWYVSYDNGTTWEALGAKATGSNGLNGTNGVDGKDGVGIAKAEINLDGELVLTYTDDTVVNLGRVVGTDGQDGADGQNGIDGKDGADGQNGIDGKDGADGKDGIDGKDGADGKNGVDGKNGTNGKDGTNGKNGIDGKNGANGKDGVNGKDGADGKNGVNGKDGKDGEDGKDGIDGKSGVDGKDGADGANGLTPVIGTNGHWWIGGSDTGVTAAAATEAPADAATDAEADGDHTFTVIAVAAAGLALVGNAVLAVLLYVLLKKKKSILHK